MICPRCKGSKFLFGNAAVVCWMCDGTGETEKYCEHSVPRRDACVDCLKAELTNEREVCSKLADRNLQLAAEAEKVEAALAASEAERERLKRTCPHCGFESPSEVSTAHGLGNHAGCAAVPLDQMKQAEAALAEKTAEFNVENNARIDRVLAAERKAEAAQVSAIALRAENERLSKGVDAVADHAALELADLKRALVESQALASRLREQLTLVRRHGFGSHWTDAESAAFAAVLALKADNAALVDVCERVGRSIGEAIAAQKDPCSECKGRGWHTGEAHPREACGVCWGSGINVKAVAARVLGGGK